MRQSTSRVWVSVLTGVLGLTGAALVEAQQVTMLKDINANPSAYHRKAVVVRGKVMMTGDMSGVNAWGQHLCGQQFLLDDETGQIPVMTVTACQQGGAAAEMRVNRGETVTIEATMDAAPSNMKTITGRGLGVSAVAKRITREDHGGVQIVIDGMP